MTRNAMTRDERILAGFVVVFFVAVAVGFVVFAIAMPMEALKMLGALALIPLAFLLFYGVGTLIDKWGV